MTDHIEDYLRKVDRHLTLEPHQRQQVLSELRSHLWETVRELQNQDPARPIEDIQHQVVQDFGAPADLAIAYNPEGSIVLTDATGSTVLTFSEAVTRAGRAVGKGAATSAKAVGKGAVVAGRGLGGFLKVLLIVVSIVIAAALLSASLVAVFLFDDIKELIEENAQASLYTGNFDNCSNAPCNGTLDPKRFYVGEETKRLRFMIAGHASGNETNGGGILVVTVRDPEGNTVMDAAYDLAPRESFWDRGVWAAQPGYWQIEVRYEDFRGHFELDVDATGLID